LATTFANIPLKYATTISHQGNVIVLALRQYSQRAPDLYYRILRPGSDGNDSWWPARRLHLPHELRAAGFNIITVPGSPALADKQFRVVSDNRYLYLFRQSGSNSLYVNRFLLVESSADGNDKPAPKLEPVWEVRYQRSRKKETPSSAKDTLGYQDLNGEPFIEPTLELGGFDLQADLADFAVMILPTSTPNLERWQFFFLQSDGSLTSYSLPRTADGLFDFGEPDETSGSVTPDIVSNSAAFTSISGGQLKMSGIAALPYSQQELFATLEEGTRQVKRQLRVMVAGTVAFQSDQEPLDIAVIDFGVDQNGQVASLDRQVDLVKLVPPQKGLLFNGGSVKCDPLQTSSAKSLTIEAWVKPRAGRDKYSVITIWDSSTTYLALSFDRSGAGQVTLATNGEQKTLEFTVGELFTGPERWVHLAFVFGANNCRFYRDGFLAVTTQDLGQDWEPDESIWANKIYIGGDSNGSEFLGQIGEVRLWNQVRSEDDIVDLLHKPISQPDEVEHLAGYWRINEGLGSTVKNYASKKGQGKVQGDYLWVNSDLPTAGIMPKLDSAGRVFGGLLGFATPCADAPALVDGDDGFVRLYYGDSNRTLTTALFNTFTARSTLVLSAGGDYSTNLRFEARRPGVLPKSASVAVYEDDDHAALCTLMVTYGDKKETWPKVPRDLNRLIPILNGGAVYNPADDTLALNGERPFYDYTGHTRTVYFLGCDDEQDGYMLLLSRINPQGINAPRPKVTLDSQTFTFEYKNGPAVEISETWCALPLNDPARISRILAGKDTAYDYNSNATSNQKIYFLAPVGDRQLWFLFNPAVTPARVQISDRDNSQLCQVTIEANVLVDDNGKSLPFTAECRRTATDFVNDLMIAISDTPLKGNLTIFNNCVDQAKVVNVFLDTPVNNLANGSFLFVALNVSLRDGGAMKNSEPALLYPINDPSLEQQDLAHGSELFRVFGENLPIDGAAVLEKSRSAHLEQGGVACQWVAGPTNAAITLKGDSCLQKTFDGDTRSALDVFGDMSIEAWVRPTKFTYVNDAPEPQCVLQYQSVEDGAATGYAIGLQGMEDYALSFAGKKKGREWVSISDFDLPRNFTIEMWVSVQGHDNQCLIARQKRERERSFGVYYNTDDGKTTIQVYLNKENYASFEIDQETDKFHLAIVVEQGKPESEVTCYIHNPSSSNPSKRESRGNDSVKAVLDPEAGNGWTLGQDASGRSHDYFEGCLNEVRVWKEARSKKEIQNNRNRTLTEHEGEDLLAYWTGNAKSLTDLPEYGQQLQAYYDGHRSESAVVVDLTGNGHDGTLMSGVEVDTSPNRWIVSPFGGDGAQLFTCFAATPQSSALSLTALQTVGKFAHIAAVYNANFALRCDGAKDYVDCGNNESLNVSTGLTLEAWVKGGGIAPPTGTVLSKYGDKPGDQSYELGIDNAGRPYFVVVLAPGNKDAETHRRFSIRPQEEQTRELWASGDWVHLAATFYVDTAVATSDEKDPDGKVATVNSQVLMTLFANGQSLRQEVYDVTGNGYINSSTAAVNLARSAGNFPGSRERNLRYFKGSIGEARIWGQALDAGTVRAVYDTRKAPRRSDGLISYWPLSEGAGDIAHDARGKNDANLSRDGLWRMTDLNASWQFYINGEPSAAVNAGPLVPFYPESQLTLGAALKQNGNYDGAFNGDIDEVRVWTSARTQSQIRANLNRPLLGDEKDLAGYWPMNEGGGKTAGDATGHGNNLALADKAEWTVSRAPVGLDAPIVLDALSRQSDGGATAIDSTPAAVSYGEMTTLDKGQVHGWLKRCYVYSQDGLVWMDAGHVVGEVDARYIGQVQTAPTLIGYVEGPPPVPSENLSRPLWTNPDADEYLRYYNASSVRLTEAQDTTYLYSASRDTGFDTTLDYQGGYFAASGLALGYGVVSVDVASYQMKYGYHTNFNNSLGWLAESQSGVGKTRTLTNTVPLTGDWEEPVSGTSYFNNEIGRRFVPQNVGYALVKSHTADLYALTLKDTGALVSYRLLANQDIPEDWNIIPFPINPTYTKLGTLDGLIGFKPDPHFPQATLGQKGSYFRPREAYALKQQIEEETKRLEAQYQQYDAGSVGRRTAATNFQKGDPGDASRPLSESVTQDASYDWAKRMAKRSLANTYVWTAESGLYSEEEDFLSLRHEASGGSYQFLGQAGALVSVQGNALFALGYFWDYDFLFGGHINTTVMKNKDENESFGLAVNVQTDSFLEKWEPGADLNDASQGAYSGKPCPGKVNAYRFMSFYLSPKKRNFEDFFDHVVDPAWLHQSSEASAAALRSAMGNKNSVWRVLHRVTYVSRVPQAFGGSRQDAVPPPAAARLPVNLVGNTALLSAVQKIWKDNNVIVPTLREIRTAVDELFVKSSLARNPAWHHLLEQVGKQVPTAVRLFDMLRRDTIAYLISYYGITDEAQARLDFKKVQPKAMGT
jgi:hypothetical protein